MRLLSFVILFMTMSEGVQAEGEGLGLTMHTAYDFNDTTTSTTTKPSTPTSLSTSTTQTTTTGSTTTATSSTTATSTGSATSGPPTSPFPTTTVKPKQKIYFFNDSSEICILLALDVKITITHPFANESMEANVEDVTKVDGACGKNKEHIALHFFKDWYLNFSFAEMNNNEYYYVDELELHYNTENFPHVVGWSEANTTSIYNLTSVSNKNGQGYICANGIGSDLVTNIGWNYTLNVKISKLRVEAFRINETSIEFKDNGVINCAANNNNKNLVPIIVGSVLIALILIVLIAYLISRRRRRAGYESV